MALRCHPDHNHSPQATEEFQFLAKVHETLSNEDKRRNYDAGVLHRSSFISHKLIHLNVNDD
jgi:curved DNA-binding protein CbpA